MTIFNSGPRDPGSYYLFHKGELQKIGSRQPLFDGSKLADVEYMEFEARDGRKIPAYVTIPQGEGPFPLVVVPHGGPFVGEVVGYDMWGQMLANHGYMVAQPQYRGSEYHGLDHFKAAFEDKSQGGRAMQDDKDDVALGLVEMGLADRDRLAMFGWSYGGYAALVAASRDPQIYQCTIAGASVADGQFQMNYLRNFSRNSKLDREFIDFWDNAVHPIDEVEKINIPLMIIHGDVDARVPIDQANRYLRELNKHGVPYRYVEIEDADHCCIYYKYEHYQQFYEALLEFLANDCGNVSSSTRQVAASSTD
jgi:dipeptidyl aminopeptidase/acylaminoacyl peptidase